MANPFLAPKRRRVFPRLIAAAVALLAFVAVGVAVESQLGPRAPKTYAPPTAIPLPGASATAGPSDEPSASSSPALSGALQLIQGAQLVNGVRIGYPHSTAGAVSAGVEYMQQIGSTLDPDRAAAVGRLVADPSWSDAPQQLAQGPTITRKELGLPATGQVPANASVVLAPVEYQVLSATANSAKVLLLATYTTSSPGQGIQTRMGVYPLDMHWSAGDWHVLASTDTTNYSSLTAQPESPDASAKGWQELKQ
ncbi:hypothetical protein [Streptacidiphilus sp. MAP5-3]|uniref:hypothetical protein n=1 Tax=unclassified Streptacidiphilus TaxID=2643834 RepID=UPI0035168169